MACADKLTLICRRAVGVKAAGVSASLVLALLVSASSFELTLTDTTPAAAVAIVESGAGSTKCSSYESAATCNTIDLYGGTGKPLSPGGAVTTAVTFTNSSSVVAAFATLKGGVCVASNQTIGAWTSAPAMPNTSSGNLCSVLSLSVYEGSSITSPIFSGSLADFETAAATDLGPLAVGTSRTYCVTIAYPAAAGQATQGQKVSQPIVWTFHQ